MAMDAAGLKNPELQEIALVEVWDQMFEALSIFKRGAVRKAPDTDEQPSNDQPPREP